MIGKMNGHKFRKQHCIYCKQWRHSAMLAEACPKVPVQVSYVIKIELPIRTRPFICWKAEP